MRTYFKSVFLLYPPKEIANFKNTKDQSSQQTLMLVAYPLPDKGYRYSIRRGSGLFISCQAFGDASLGINKKSFHAFFV